MILFFPTNALITYQFIWKWQDLNLPVYEPAISIRNSPIYIRFDLVTSPVSPVNMPLMATYWTMVAMYRGSANTEVEMSRSDFRAVRALTCEDFSGWKSGGSCKISGQYKIRAIWTFKSACGLEFGLDPESLSINLAYFISGKADMRIFIKNEICTLKISLAQARNASSWPHSSSPSPTSSNRSPLSSPSNVSMTWANAQKLGYALDPSPKTANL